MFGCPPNPDKLVLKIKLLNETGFKLVVFLLDLHREYPEFKLVTIHSLIIKSYPYEKVPANCLINFIRFMWSYKTVQCTVD